MKRVACISTIQSSPSDSSFSFLVMDIFNSTRSYNVENKITGAFVVFGNYLLMIVEGESTSLANIVFEFRNDKRLDEFSLILKEDIAAPGFSSWGFKLLKEGCDGQERIFAKLKSVFQDKLTLNSPIDKERITCFIQPSAKSTTAPKFEDKTASTMQQTTTTATRSASLEPVDFSQSMLSLAAWPKPGRIKLCPELMKLCARLISRPHKYEDLVKSKITPSEEALQGYLNALYNLGILRKYSVDDKPPLVGIIGGKTEEEKVSSTDRFSAVLKNFLSASKQ